MFTKIAVVGTGNIGTWLFQILQTQKNLSVISVSSRKIETLPKDYDLYIFALKDDVYEDVLKKISFKMSNAVHTSGSLSQQILAPFATNFGILYPYQTVCGERYAVCGERFAVSGERCEAPVCVEGADLYFEEELFQWASSIFKTVSKINERQRFAMHLAAVFANNFTNAMYGIAYDIFKENGLDWSLIIPLLEQTLENAKHGDPHLFQTGPARRGDVTILEKHSETLQNEDLKNLYRIVSKIINH